MCIMMWCLYLFVLTHANICVQACSLFNLSVQSFSKHALSVLCSPIYTYIYQVHPSTYIYTCPCTDVYVALMCMKQYMHMKLLCLSNCMYDIYGDMHNTSQCSVCFYVYTHMQANPHHFTISRQAPSLSLCIVLPLCMLCLSLSLCIIVSVQEMCLAYVKYTYVTCT